MTKAASLIAAILAAAAVCLAAVRLGHAMLDWIRANPAAVAMGLPLLPAWLIGLVAIDGLRRWRARRA